MYLKGSKWNLRKRRKQNRINPAFVVLILILIGAVFVFNQFIIPQLPTQIIPTPTPTQHPEDILAEAELNFEDGNMVRAVELYAQAVQLDPTNHEIYLKMARTQIFASQFEAARTSATNALLLSPNNVEALAYLGSALTYLEDYDQARERLDNALSLSPDFGLAHAFYAELMIALDDVELASEYSNSALGLSPNSFEVHRARGYVLGETGNHDEALAEYLAANEINGSVAELHIMLGRTLIRQMG
jgi:tetratricopeptide (TPR) repeat protein